METIHYIGEHLWAGAWGHFFVVLLFASSLFSSITYFLSTHKNNLLSLARTFLFIHIGSVVMIFALLLWMLFHHYFEYQYVWQHSNKAMDMQFIFSCLWEGQEGSFLLWIFWQAVISLFFYKTLQSAEPIVMGIYMLTQTFLATMILGVYVGDVKIGSSMFLLLREHPNFMNLPFLQNPDYLSTLDGRGLNPLLANYWMTIHPPTLFLGFASTLVPFSLALNGLITNNYYSWQKQGVKWAFFSVLVLGAGILMGGAWAYEALSFGGFWAWDPVENSSLVPWLLITAAAHLMILNNKNKGSYFVTHFFSIAAFILVLYSTFLTRSGILGNASVHAFTDLGMQGQLLLFILFFAGLSVWAFIKELLLKNFYWMISAIFLYFAIIVGYQKAFLFTWVIISVALLIYTYIKNYHQKDEEELASKEFWMFLGSLLLFISGIIIIYFTSVPVLNKLFNMNKAPIPAKDYNTWMMPMASIIFLVTGISQYLKYQQKDFSSIKKFFLFDSGISLIISVILYFTVYFNDSSISSLDKLFYFLLLIFSIYSVVANFHYWTRITKSNLKKLGQTLSHAGFALLILGALISTSKKSNIIPVKTSSLINELGESFDKQKSIVLFQGDTVQAGNFLINFEGKEKNGFIYFFKVNYFSTDKKPLFTLYPRVQDNPIMGKAADPDTKHYLFYDIYTHITYADLSENSDNSMNAFEPVNYKGHLHDTIVLDKALVVFDSLYANKTYEEFSKNSDELEITIRLKVIEANGKYTYAYPKYFIKNKTVVPTTAKVEHLNINFTIWKLYPDTEEIELAVVEKKQSKDFIVMEASVFPFINLLWLGCFTMSVGVLLYLIQKLKKQ
ncbi:MAG TPA: cytochrome c biogenesis protein CcsA [Bacteroidia bacterium]|nr:cytochrome c biogenesis protein CcsA [Bacteroidia bacterium]